MDSDCETENNRKKVVLVGDEKCGKIGLIFSYFSGTLPDPNDTPIYKQYETDVDVEGTNVPLEIWKAPVQEHYSMIRPLTYEDSSVIILCFAIDDPTSFTNAADKWYPEVRKHLPNVPVVLVGTKSDLRSDEDVINRLTDQSMKPVAFELGKSLADRLNIHSYVECSAKNNEGVENVFNAAASAALKMD